jgi:hypothetical protein
MTEEDNKIAIDMQFYIVNDKVPEVAKYIMRNKLSISEQVWYYNDKAQCSESIFYQFWFAVADHILGWTQENANYEGN